MRTLLMKAAAGGGGGGGGGPTISLSNVSATISGTSTVSATYSVRSDGTVQTNGSFFENWISDPASAGNYEVQAVLSSGDTPSGTLGSYLALTSNRTWTLTNPISGTTKACVLTVTIRKTGTATVLATATITMSAEHL
jgi:hypothetical protein